MLPSNSLASLIGADVFDSENDKIGTIAQIYTDAATGQATWASVPSGLFGRGHTFVPLHEATADDNETVRLPFDSKFVKHAPHVDTDDNGALTKADEEKLLEYYETRNRSDAEPAPRDEHAPRDEAPLQDGPAPRDGSTYVIPDADASEPMLVTDVDEQDSPRHSA